MKTKHILMACFAILFAVSIMSGEPAATEVLTIGAVAGFAVGDALLKSTLALPADDSAVTSAAIDLGHGSNGQNLVDAEFLVEAPALTTGQLGDAATMTYAVVTSASSNLSSPTVINSAIITQTGADGAGAAAATARFRLPTDCQRYVGLRATNSAAADASAASAVLSLKF